MNLPRPDSRVPLIVLVSLLGMAHLAAFAPVYRVAPERMLTTDSATYLNTARALIAAGHFAVSPDQPDMPQLIRTPGYPAFLAAIFWLCGGEATGWVIAAQILLHLGTVISMYALADMLWDRPVALVASALLALDFLSFVSAQTLLTETLFAGLLSLTALTAFHTLHAARARGWALLTGFWLALSILVRPIAYYLIAPLAGLLLGIRKTRGDCWKRAAVTAISFGLPCLLLVGGWQWRNYQLTGRADFSVIQGANLLFYKGADIVARRDGIPFTQAQQQLGYARYKQLETAPDLSARAIADLNQQWQAQGSELIRRHPGLFIKGHVRGLFSLLLETDWHVLLVRLTGEYPETSGPGGDLFTLSPRQYLRKWVVGRPRYVALFGLAAAHLLLIYVGFGLSLWRILRTRSGPGKWGMHCLLWLMLLYLLVFSAGAQANPRFRIPLMPFFALYAGYGLAGNNRNKA